MSDGGFLNSDNNLEAPKVASSEETPATELVAEQPVETTTVEPSPAPVMESAPIAATDLFEGEDEVAQAERAAAEEAQKLERQESFLEEPIEQQVTTQVTASSNVTVQSNLAAPVPEVKDEVVLEVEKILEDGLGIYFEQLSPDVKQRFLSKGKEIASQIAFMVRRFQVKVKRVVGLIRDWLQTIPGVNKFFLEQEAKIKTDRILILEEAHRLPVA